MRCARKSYGKKTGLKWNTGLFLFLLTAPAYSGGTSTKDSITVYGDIYFSDSIHDNRNERPNLYSTQPIAQRRPAVNYLMIRFEKKEKSWRGSVGLHTGTYVQANYANETQINSIIEKANFGFSPGSDLWIDAGVMDSHIGNEGAVHFGLPNLSRSIIADLSPFYQNGLAISYEGNERLTLKLLILNGWQRIGGASPAASAGWLLGWHLLPRLYIASASFAGNTGSGVRTRLFHNLMLQWAPFKTLELNLAVDVGSDSNGDSGKFNEPFTGFSFTQVLFLTSGFSLNGRIEYYNDPSRSIVTIDPGGALAASPFFQVYGASMGADYRIENSVIVRAEVRYLQSQNNVFITEKGGIGPGSNLRKNELIATLSIAGYLYRL